MNKFDDFTLDNYWEQYEKLEQIEELDQLGLDYESELKYAKAEKLYQQAADLAESLEDLSLMIRERYNLAEMQRLQGKYTQALSTYTWFIGIANNPAQSSQLTEDDLRYVGQGFFGLLVIGSYLSDWEAVNLKEVIFQGLDWLVRIGKPEWSVALRLERALLWQSQRKYEDALVEMEAALAQKRRNLDAPGVNLGSYVLCFSDLLRKIGKLAESKQYYQELTCGDQFPDDHVSDHGICYAWQGLAEIALQEGDLEEAEICADKSLELARIIESLDPLIFAYDLLTRIYRQQGQIERTIEAAIQTWRYARQYSREDLLYGSYLNIAQIRIDQGKQKNPKYYIRKAKQWLERSYPLALRLDRKVGLTENQDEIRRLEAECTAILAVDRGKLEEAIASYERAIQLNPKDADLHNDCGETYLILKRYKDALDEFNHAIKIESDNDWYLYDQTLAYFALNQTDKAQASIVNPIDLAQKRYEKDPKNWRNTFHLALYHLATGEEERAERLYREALFSGASEERIQEAIRDVDHFLIVFPEHSKAKSMRKLLKAGRNN